MFKVEFLSEDLIKLWGRFSAADVQEAETELVKLTKTTTVDMSKLEYISSAGLSVLLKIQKMLKEKGFELILTNMNKLVKDLFHYVGFDNLFTIK